MPSPGEAPKPFRPPPGGWLGGTCEPVTQLTLRALGLRYPNGMIEPGTARQDLDALTDELTTLLEQIQDRTLRRRALATLIQLNTLHNQLVDAFARTGIRAAIAARERHSRRE